MGPLQSVLIGAASGVGMVATFLLLSPGCGTPVTGRTFDPAAPAFPTVKGESLNNRAFTIPAGLDAPFNVLLVAFYRGQQSQVDTWLPTARQLIGEHANVEYYELPTISGSWGLLRGWIDGGMQSGIPDFGARERTVTIYTDTSKFRELAGIENPDQIWVGLVDREGRVYWSARGPATEAALGDLRRVVREVASPAAP
jgi:hypothetical protein